MSTDEIFRPASGFDIDSARLAPGPEPVEHADDVLSGGDAAAAPHTLTEPELRPSDGDSSGTSWDDPEEL